MATVNAAFDPGRVPRLLRDVAAATGLDVAVATSFARLQVLDECSRASDSSARAAQKTWSSG